ncbi:hypothetical protein BO94DRAFT_305057 [Aspergillus sclerotioniger CBS 115572]|uniref:Uncharacterized protein n=1 Tax=Aspergillus sclerotioniger CBS 115572 TaxID=1450535 RepID=A0A317V1M0_9EURO|nr:hypothetical protein BO94DRAFT_305057 [Aspergillus sclerotioniger CBS 115572]PWY67965.1 hypothetical protein BO94DRAFT_305057 [Aspergillus sclerotioniger CBS 115572]
MLSRAFSVRSTSRPTRRIQPGILPMRPVKGLTALMSLIYTSVHTFLRYPSYHASLPALLTLILSRLACDVRDYGWSTVAVDDLLEPGVCTTCPYSLRWHPSKTSMSFDSLPSSSTTHQSPKTIPMIPATSRPVD